MQLSCIVASYTTNTFLLHHHGCCVRLDLRTSLLTCDYPPYRESFPKEHAVDLKDLILDITGASILAGRSNVTLRKLFVSVRPLPSCSPDGHREIA